ncbi:MAG: diguanylate cyclase [Chloroflexi bacterium]|nr:diguanylate cyclase [Chloroflexota bacterium]
MSLQIHPNSIPFIVAISISTLIAVAIWPRRSAPGAIALFVHMLALTLWSASAAFMWLSVTLADQIFWLNVSTLGILIVPGTLFLFSLQVSLQRQSVPLWALLVLSIEPLTGLALIWTNDFHRLVYSQPQLWIRNGLSELHWAPGPFIGVDALYSYVLILAGIWFLIRGVKKGGSLMQAQFKLVLLGVCLSLLADVVSLLPFLTMDGGLDAAPIVYTLAGGFYIYAMYRKRLLDLMPVAHSVLIGSMTDGVIVLDAQDRILEMNSAAAQFLGLSASDAAGRRAREVLTTWRETTRPFWDQPDIRTETLVTGDIPRTIDLKITPLMDDRKHTLGRLMVFRDITMRKQNEAILKDANKQLNEQLREISALRDQLREQATRDPLTNLFNRRYLEESLQQELARALRENYPVCVLMMDIDRFKLVNDTCGHKVGDDILQALASLIVLKIRRFDVACRFGGEEFVVVMPMLLLETARERAELLRQEFASMPLPCSSLKESPTISIGVACYPFDGTDSETLIKAADRALYAAKGSGRNRVATYGDVVKSALSDTIQP